MYTPDAVIDDVSAGANRTVDQMIEFLSRALQKVVGIQHAVSTSLVEWAWRLPFRMTAPPRFHLLSFPTFKPRITIRSERKLTQAASIA